MSEEQYRTLEDFQFEFIRSRLGTPALLEQMAEEASELSQACLKLARIMRGENPTPVTDEAAQFNLIEEFTDVNVCADILELPVDRAVREYKISRWVKRLDEGVE